jgi:Ca2+-binding EF-hand superfamily protein
MDKESIRLCFEMIDVDRSGTIDQEEFLQALNDNSEVKKFVASSEVLRPLLDSRLFAQAFKAMDTDDEAGVSLDEFQEFCLIAREVVMLNSS